MALFRRLLLALGLAAAPSSQVVQAQDTGDQERFHHAVGIGDVETVRSLLASDRSLATSRDRFEFQPVHLMDMYFEEEILDLLLAAGADINAVNDEGVTILHVITDPDAVEILVNRGANLETRDKLGRTPLVAQSYNTDNGPDVIDALLATGADPNATDDTGETALSLAQSTGDEEFLDVLRHHGVDR